MSAIVRILGLFVNFGLYALICAKVTDKQYASMPSLFYQDNYDKCMGLEDEALYCSFTYELEPLDPTDIPDIWKIIHEVSSDQNNYRHDHLRHGICVPFTCPSAMNSRNNTTALRNDITKCYDKNFKKIGLKGNITSLSCETTKFPYTVDGLDVTVATFFIIYVAFVIFASVYEGILRCKPMQYEHTINTRLGRILSAFSLARNWENLKTVKSNPNVESLRSLQGIRFYNMVIVIWSHTAMYLLQTKQINPSYVEKIRTNISSVFLSTGSLTLTTNFFISTFFLTNEIFTRFEGKKYISTKFILSAIISRWLRLTPTFAFVLMFHATWLRHLGSGPSWTFVAGNEYLRCRKNGWLNLLYSNTILNSGDRCMGQTWYLSNDMQYFIILLPILCYMLKHASSIWPILGGLLAVNIVGTFLENYARNFEPFLMLIPELIYEFKLLFVHPQKDYQLDSFIGNLTGSIFGIGFGYLYYKYRNQKLFTSNVLLHKIVYNIVSFGLPLGIIILPGIYFIVNKVEHDPLTASLYFCIQKAVFVLGIGYLIFGTTQGIGGVIKHCLNWSPLYVLGRLTYSTYLVHIAVLIVKNGSVRSPVYGNDFLVVHSLMGDTFLSFIIGLLLNLFVEAPALELQKIYFPLKQEVKKKEY